MNYRNQNYQILNLVKTISLYLLKVQTASCLSKGAGFLNLLPHPSLHSRQSPLQLQTVTNHNYVTMIMDIQPRSPFPRKKLSIPECNMQSSQQNTALFRTISMYCCGPGTGLIREYLPDTGFPGRLRTRFRVLSIKKGDFC